jgi:effector-binding domain-containing protein
MTTAVRMEQVSSQPLAVVRRRVKEQELSRVVPEACGLVWGVLKKHNLTGGRHVAVYLDGEINLEVGAELDAPFSGSGDVVPSTTPSGAVATATHFGPYGQLHETHQAINDWCAKSGHTKAGPSWEIYGHWTPACDKDPSQIRTDVFYLLK